MKYVLVTPPVYFPVTLTEIKDHLRVDHTDDDTYIQGLIVAATAKAEQHMKRRLITQTWKMFLDAWPVNEIVLPFGQLDPTSHVTHVKYTDVDGDQSTWSTDDYNVDTDSDPGRITLEYGYAWPTVSLHPQNPIEIQFTCGYGAHTPQAITAATNASPIVLTVASHGRTANDTVLVESVAGNTNANGVWKITAPTTSTIGLLTSSGNADYTSGGTLICLEVPEAIRQAIKLMISDMYENREDFIAGTTYKKLAAAEALMAPYRLYA